MVKKYKFKVALIGDFGAGKSSLYRRLVDPNTENRFDPNAEEDLECDFQEIKVCFEDKQCQVFLWDTAGLEKHNSMEGSYFRGLHGFLLVYDVCTWKSYERIDFWKEQISAYAVDGVQMLLCGNKCDVPAKQRVVEEYEGKTLAAKLGIQFFECSGKTGNNCQKALHALCKGIVESSLPGILVQDDCTDTSKPKVDSGTKITNSKSVALSADNRKQKKSCC